MPVTDPEHSKERAIAAFLAEGEAHRNCAQAVLLFGLDALGDDPERVGIARYLGGGIGRSGLSCGVLTGAALVLAVRDERAGSPTLAQAAEACREVQDLRRSFEQRFGATSCAELTGCDLATATGAERFAAERVRHTTCVGFVAWMCDRLAELL